MFLRQNELLSLNKTCISTYSKIYTKSRKKIEYLFIKIKYIIHKKFSKL